MRPRTAPRPRLLRVISSAAVVLFGLVAVGAPAGAEPPGRIAHESAQPGITTTTLPIDNRQVGEIIPQPNAGREPQTAGDPGGWLQASLFFLLIAALAVIAGAVWWTSRRARERRAAAGMDPVNLARRRGEGVRHPRDGAGSATGSADPSQDA